MEGDISPLAADGSPFDLLPNEMLQVIFSFLSPSDQFLSKLVSRRWRAVITTYLPHHLHLRQFRSHEEYKSAVLHVLPYMPWLHGLHDLQLADVGAVQGSCPQLKAMAIYQESMEPMDMWDLMDMWRLSTGFPCLQEVTLSVSATDAEVELLLENKPGLRKLTLDGADVTGTCFKKLPAGLKYLSVSRCRNVLHVSELQLPYCPQLQVLKVGDRDTKIRLLNREADVLALLVSCPGLTSLNLNHAEITGACLQQIPLGLEHLSMFECDLIQPVNFRHVARCAQLHYLNASGVEDLQDDDVAAVLSGCPRLSTLIMAQTAATGACLKLLPRTLDQLSLSACGSFDSASLLHVAKCDRLRRLDVSYVPDLQAAHLAAVLTACPHLEELDADVLGCPLEECLPAAELKALHCLRVYESEYVTDNTLSVLPDHLSQLQKLDVSYCENVTETGLMHLGRFRQLRWLDLSRLPVTDAVLFGLHGMQLEELWLTSCGMEAAVGFTAEGVVQLILSCPGLDGLVVFTSDTPHQTQTTSLHVENDSVLSVVDGLVRTLDTPFTAMYLTARSGLGLAADSA